MSSDSDDDNFIRYGTPLEPYEEDEIPSKRKYQQPADQYAVDEHGRRRFHGAFTGGFSAGFGNTVGSQEGWTPTSFKSSRAEKASDNSQRPEDFMDDEDRSEFGIAPRHVQTHSDFSGQKRARPRRQLDGPIPGEPVLEQVLRPVHETAAVKILRSMGWRPGQGTGDRLTKEQKKKVREQQKVYGCFMPPEMRQETTQSDNDSSDSDTDLDYDTLFAPDDYEPYLLHRKNDRFGIGYQGLSRHSVLGNLVGEYGSEGTTSKLVMKDKGKRVSIRGQAFGVGAFEADDEDIYATEDMSHYDFTLGGPTPTKPKQNTKKDGSQVLEGFVRSSKGLPSIPSYPAPALPRDYVPVAAGARKSRFEPIQAPQRDQGLGRHELTANARGQLLGEIPIKQTDTETNTQADKQADNQATTDPTNLLAKITGRVIDFSTEASKGQDYISIKDSGKELKNVFKPFASNPLKQRRYETFLENQALEKDSEMDKLSEWERERELMEFEQAAKLYKPLTGIMGDRFTHASEPDDSTNPLTVVAKSSINYGSATKEQIEAAAKGVYGIMTRKETPWRPESIVCKRFNIQEPGVTRLEPKKDDKPKVSYSIFSYLESSVYDKDSFTKEQTKFSGSKSLSKETHSVQHTGETSQKPKNVSEHRQTTVNNLDTPKTENQPIVKETNKVTSTSNIEVTNSTKRMTVAELFLKESEKNKAKGEEVTETINKFDKMDLYKSIFLSDTEDEEEAPQTNLTDFVDAPKNVLRNTSPPRGIFANIDFDEINLWRQKVPEKKETLNSNLVVEKKPESSEKNSQKASTDAQNSAEVVNEVYGPMIPENIQKRLEQETTLPNKPIEINSSSSDSWVDANEIKKKKKKKVKHKKHKSKHKKSKHKKKDK